MSNSEKNNSNGKDDIKEIVEHIAALVNNPHTPKPVVEALLSAVVESMQYLDLYAPETIEMCLRGYVGCGSSKIPDIHVG